MVRRIDSSKIQFSRRLRQHPTAWEEKLWQHLKEKNLGVRFKRQLVIGPFIVDFSCNNKKLIIELNGSPHREKSDTEKINFLKSSGYKVLIFWNREIDTNINGVLNKIIKELN